MNAIYMCGPAIFVNTKSIKSFDNISIALNINSISGCFGPDEFRLSSVCPIHIPQKRREANAL